jgi:DNA-directed RNA polymerase II subunit RPB1
MEMNMFAPQSIQTQTELAMISDIKRQIMSPMHAKPVIKLKQDALIGSHQMTEKPLTIDWHHAMNMMMYAHNTDVLQLQKKDILSTDLYSMIIPEAINYKSGDAQIKNGKLISGVAEKKLAEQIMIMTWDKYDPQKTKVYIDNAQRITAYWLINHGFTVGLRDACPTKDIRALAKKMIAEKEIEVEHLITEIENNPELLDADLFEEDVKAKLNRRVDLGKSIMKLLNSDNHFYTMANSGAKGDAETNIGPIMGALAQDLLKQRRIPKQVNGRTLPHFFQNDDRPMSRGYIKSSYYEGLEPHEFWFHHMTGREGLISTAIKTAETGYQQRKMIKGLEDIKVMYDGTVRTGNNTILQLIYGGNNYELTKQKYVKLHIMDMGNTEIKTKYGNLADTMIEMRDKMREYQKRALIDYKNHMDVYLQTVNFIRIVTDGKNYEVKKKEPLTEEHVMMTLNEVLSHRVTPLLTMISPEENPLKHLDEQRLKFLFKLCLYEYIAPKRCIEEYKFSKEQFTYVIKEIVKSYNSSMINYGEMVGVVTAQSVGEPLTQQTLSSFHKTGAGGLQGAERFRELLGYTKNIKTPYMNIYLKEEYRNNKVLAHKIASHLKYTVLKDITKKIMIIYDSDVENKRSYTVRDDMDQKSIFGINNDKVTSIGSMPWLFRISLNKEAMLENDVNMLDIKTQFIQFWNNTFTDLTGAKKMQKDFLSKILRGCILSNYNNSDKPTVHIRFELSQTDNNMQMELYDIILNKFRLKGSEQVMRVDDIMEETMINYNNPDGVPVNEKEFVIYANGIDLNMIKHIPMIDMKRTYCNSLLLILKNYGIEAARAYLIHEMPLQFTNPKPIAQHQMLIADLMTSTGTITSIDRHGMNRMDRDPLSKASFEKMMEHFVNAAMFSEVDTLQSVSSQIMLGKQFKGGTGMCELAIDNDMLENMSSVEIGGSRPDPNAIQLTTSSLMNDILKMDSIMTFIPED